MGGPVLLGSPHPRHLTFTPAAPALACLFPLTVQPAPRLFLPLLLRAAFLGPQESHVSQGWGVNTPPPHSDLITGAGPGICISTRPR